MSCSPTIPDEVVRLWKRRPRGPCEPRRVTQPARVAARLTMCLTVVHRAPRAMPAAPIRRTHESFSPPPCCRSHWLSWAARRGTFPTGGRGGCRPVLRGSGPIGSSDLIDDLLLDHHRVLMISVMSPRARQNRFGESCASLLSQVSGTESASRGLAAGATLSTTSAPLARPRTFPSPRDRQPEAMDAFADGAPPRGGRSVSR